MAERFDVGGQAVIEGVMMRSPKSFAVVCRRPTGEIVIKEDIWKPVWGGVRFLRWPFLRGSVVLVESLLHGFSALSFAADQATIAELEAERAKKEEPKPQSLGAAAAKSKEPSAFGKWLMLIVSLGFGLALFVGAPHLAAWGLGTIFGFDASTFAFHAVDGVIKAIILISYLAVISLLPDIRRVFQYHGAEHKSIFCYEKGLPLTIDNARAQSRFHPRCGTSFLLIVVMISIVIFASLLSGRIAESTTMDHLVKILLKIPLMLPVAGLSYELLKLSGRAVDTSALARAMAKPGMWLQKITTREPDDAQLEIALISIRKTLWRERQTEVASGGVEVFKSAQELDLPYA
jgi:uncharacterized protein YqhQ